MQLLFKKNVIYPGHSIRRRILSDLIGSYQPIGFYRITGLRNPTTDPKVGFLRTPTDIRLSEAVSIPTMGFNQFPIGYDDHL